MIVKHPKLILASSTALVIFVALVVTIALILRDGKDIKTLLLSGGGKKDSS